MSNNMNYVWKTLQMVIEKSQEPIVVVIIENQDITFTKEYENTLYSFKTQLETQIVFPIYLKDTPDEIKDKFKDSLPLFFGYEAQADFYKPKYFLDGVITENLV